MREDSHPSPGSPDWDNPDYCPFCGADLRDGGAGFVEHIEQEDHATCRDRFEEWRENVVNDIEGDWSG